jgi:hypothetical protein
MFSFRCFQYLLLVTAPSPTFKWAFQKGKSDPFLEYPWEEVAIRHNSGKLSDSIRISEIYLYRVILIRVLYFTAPIIKTGNLPFGWRLMIVNNWAETKIILSFKLEKTGIKRCQLSSSAISPRTAILTLSKSHLRQIFIIKILKKVWKIWCKKHHSISWEKNIILRDAISDITEWILT